MNGLRSYVVCTTGGDFGLQIVRHPSQNPQAAMDKAEEMSRSNPGTTYYVAEVYGKVYTPLTPTAEFTLLK